jgi:hypothetical protein
VYAKVLEEHAAAADLELGGEYELPFRTSRRRYLPPSCGR